nr:hypothetical protein [Tanacetum cinerariifolium]
MDEQAAKAFNESDIIQIVFDSGIRATSSIFNLPIWEVKNIIFRKINHHQDVANTSGEGYTMKNLLPPDVASSSELLAPECMIVGRLKIQLATRIPESKTIWMMSDSLKALGACSSIIEVEEIEEEGYERCMAGNNRSSQSSPRSYTQEQVVQMTRQHQEEVGSSWYTPPPMYWPTPPTYGPPPPTYGPTAFRSHMRLQKAGINHLCRVRMSLMRMKYSCRELSQVEAFRMTCKLIFIAMIAMIAMRLMHMIYHRKSKHFVTISA